MTTLSLLRRLRAAFPLAAFVLALAAAPAARAGYPRPEQMDAVREIAFNVEVDAEAILDAVRGNRDSYRDDYAMRALADLSVASERFHEQVDRRRMAPSQTEIDFRRLTTAYEAALRFLPPPRADRATRRSVDRLSESMGRLVHYYADARPRASAWLRVRSLADRAEEQAERAYDLARDETRGGFFDFRSRSDRQEKALDRFKELEKASDRHNDQFERRPVDIDGALRAFERFIDRYNLAVERVDAFSPRVEDALYTVGDYLYDLQRAYEDFLDSMTVYETWNQPGPYDRDDDWSRGRGGVSSGAAGGLKSAPGVQGGVSSGAAAPSAADAGAGAGEPLLKKGSVKPKLNAPSIIRRKGGAGASGAPASPDSGAPSPLKGAAPGAAASPESPESSKDRLERLQFPEIKRAPGAGPAGTTAPPPGS